MISGLQFALFDFFYVVFITYWNWRFRLVINLICSYLRDSNDYCLCSFQPGLKIKLGISDSVSCFDWDFVSADLFGCAFMGRLSF